MENNNWISGDLLSSSFKDSMIGKANNRLVKTDVDKFNSRKTVSSKYLTGIELREAKELIEKYEENNGEISGTIFSRIAKMRAFK